MTGSEILIEGLIREGVDHIFGYAGATICPIDDALLSTPQIAYTLVRNEQNAGHMASGYARTTGKVGVCLVTSGPGATNLLTGIATAHMDSVPIVAITGQVPSGLLGRDIFQEVDITGAAAAFTKHSFLVKNAADLPAIIRKAFSIAASGRPGAVLIDIPVDVQKQVVNNVEFPESVYIRGYNPSVKGNDKQIAHVAKAINEAKQPVLCAGGGVFLAGAKEKFAAFAEKTGIPVVTTMMGLSLLPTEHPLNMGMIGSHGNKCANKALAKSDLLIMLGMRVADRAILQPDEIKRRMPSVHIDVDPAEIGKNIQSEIPLVGDVGVILDQLSEKEIQGDCADWLATLRAMRDEELGRSFEAEPGTVHPGALMKYIGSRLKEDASVCVDVGLNQIWACKHLRLNGARFLTSGGLGTMGYALPAAIGVKAAAPEKQVLVVCGDGSFQMEMNELAAVCAEHMDIKLVLIRNHVLGMVHEIQNKEPYHGAFGVSLDGSPDFEKLAAAYGIKSIVVSDNSDIEKAADDFLGTEGPCILIAEVDPSCGVNS